MALPDKIHSYSSDDIKGMTVKLLDLFYETDHGDLKWSLLKEYKTKFLTTKSFDQDIVTSYLTISSTLLDCLKPGFFAERSQESVFDEIFLQGVLHESFLLLVNRMAVSEGYKQKKILSLLMKFVQGSSLRSLVMDQCISQAGWDLRYVSKSHVWNDLLSALISLPDKVCGITQGKCVKLFMPNCYVPLLVSTVLKNLVTIHGCLKNDQDCSLEFLAKLCGRLCMVGHQNIFAYFYVKHMISVAESDFIWRRISLNFISKMPPTSLDVIISAMLVKIPWYGYMEWIFGDEGVKNERIYYFLTVKLIFIKTFPEDFVLQNIIGYLASSPSREPAFLKLLKSLLDCWVDERALRCRSLEQNIYIAAALMTCTAWLKKLRCKVNAEGCVNKVLHGVSLRLSSSDETVKSVGMIVGQSFIKSLEVSDSSLGQHEIKDTSYIERFNNLAKIPPMPVENDLIYEDLRTLEQSEAEVMSLEENTSSSEEIPKKTAVNSEFDSDDDLEPYDMSNDTAVAGTKQPLYLRDCMKGLIEQEDAEYTEQCLKQAEQLIKNNLYATKEVAEEMAKILLHLDDKFAIPKFLELRHRILIALTVECPESVSAYLISQFTARDYNIRQRLDILEVLAASSMLLSRPNAVVKTPKPCISTEDFATEKDVSWKMIVKSRIEAKTKYFTKAQKSAEYENKFSTVARQFLFPLMNSYDRGSDFFNLKKENYVLGRFIYTLGIIMHSASNTTHCLQMGKELLKFLPAFRTNSDPFVRQAVLFAVAATYVSVNPNVLLKTVLSDGMDTTEWLENVIKNDPEKACVEKAIWTQSLFNHAVSLADSSNVLMFGCEDS